MKLNILMICDCPPSHANAGTIIDHLESFGLFSKHNFFYLSFKGVLPKTLDLQRFDVIVIHYSSYILNYVYIDPAGQNKIRDYTGIKVLYIQDEYREVDFMSYKINQLKIDLLFTCFPEKEIEKVYPSSKLPNLIKVNVLTGYVPQRLVGIELPSTKMRLTHIGYRGRKLPYWYGRLAYEKWNIVDKFFEHARNANIKYDLSYHEADRIYGDNWIFFLAACKCTLGVESGSSVVDFDGTLQILVEKYQKEFPEATFDEVHEKFLVPFEGKISLNQISPRCFEAMALKTVLVLYEGEYSKVILPDVHFIVLKKDFSNVREVIARIKDDSFLQRMADRAYSDVILNPSFSYVELAIKFDKELDLLIANKLHFSSINNPYSMEEFNQHIEPIKPIFDMEKRAFCKKEKISLACLINPPKYFSHDKLKSKLRACSCLINLKLKSIFRRVLKALWKKLPLWVKKYLQLILGRFVSHLVLKLNS